MRKLLLTLAMFAVMPAVIRAQSAAWADKLFLGKGTTSHDFGTVPLGTKLFYRFPMKNPWQVPVQLMTVRASCGCVTPTPSTQVLQPLEEGYIDIAMDAARVHGSKTVSIFVTLGPQYISTATLRVSATTRADVVFNPGQISFGVVSQGQTPSQAADVEYAGTLDWKVTDVNKNGVPVDVSVKEIYRRPGQVGYRVQATLKPNAPAGLLKQEMLLSTNDSETPLVPLLVEATVQAALVVKPEAVDFGSVKMGESATRRLVVRANQPFKIVGVDGLGSGIDADLPSAPAATQIIVIKYQPSHAEGLRRELRIKTDLEKEKSATVVVEGAAVP